MEKDPIFGFRIPSTCGNVPGEILKPAQAWNDSSVYASEAKKLAAKFIKNFRQFKRDIPRAVAKSGPMLDGD
jgi:phosphoenolpyruvate carboxykinase (ATP)